MNITLSFSELIIGFGGLSAIILTLAFIIRIQQKNLAGIWLIGFCLANVFVIIVKILYSTGYIIEFPHFLRWKFPIGLTRPIFFFLFILYLYKGIKKVNFKHMFHFSPAIIVFIYFIPLFFTAAIEKVSWLNGQQVLQNANLPGWYFYFISAYSVFYLAFSFHIFIKHRHLTQKLLNIFVSSIFAGSLVFIIIAVLNVYFGGLAELNDIMYLVLSSAFLFISFIILASPTGLKIGQDIKYQSSNINQKRSHDIFNKALNIVHQQKLYKNSELKLTDLANQISEPSYLLSHAINQQTSKTFNDFINQMRIDEAIILISNGNYRHLTLEAIGYEVGFNSRSSFYAAFKKIKNCTPASFKKTIAV